MVAPASGRAGKVGRRNELSHCSVLLPMHHAACDCRAPVSPRTLRSTDQSGLQSSSDHSYSYALRCRAGFRGECQRALCHDGLVGKCKGSIAFRSPRSHGSVFPQSLLLAQICRYLQYLVSHFIVAMSSPSFLWAQVATSAVCSGIVRVVAVLTLEWQRRC